MLGSVGSFPNSSVLGDPVARSSAAQSLASGPVLMAVAFALAAAAILDPSRFVPAPPGQKVAVIVGPVGGGSIQTNYLNRGEQIAQSAEARGATVARVFSPNAT